MKLFIKILFFIFTMIIITVGEVKSSIVVTISQGKISYLFFEKSQLGTVIFENHNANSCVNGENVVAYSERGKEREGVVAKGGTVRFGKNFSSKALSNNTLTSAEKTIAKEAHEILNSSEFEKIIKAHSTKTPVQIEINGRAISYDDAPFSGMTWFEKNGFNVGREAFSSDEELIKTVLHEMHRLETSTLRGSGTAAEVAKETKAAFNFAEKSYILFE